MAHHKEDKKTDAIYQTARRPENTSTGEDTSTGISEGGGARLIKVIRKWAWVCVGIKCLIFEYHYTEYIIRHSLLTLKPARATAGMMRTLNFNEESS